MIGSVKSEVPSLTSPKYSELFGRGKRELEGSHDKDFSIDSRQDTGSIENFRCFGVIYHFWTFQTI